MKLVVIKLPVTDPLIKLRPTIKPIGKSIVLSIKKKEDYEVVKPVWVRRPEDKWGSKFVLRKEVKPDNFDFLTIFVGKDIELKNIDIGSKIALRNVFFDTGKAEVKIDSYPELDRLIQLMKDVPSLMIELSGHTDNVGSDAANQNLSQRRAQAVRAYLVSRSVDDSRVTAIGYGASRPVESNSTKAGRANNRRTEFEIIAN